MEYKKAGYLGPEGSYSYMAAGRLCGGAELCAYPTFYAAVRALISGRVDAAVLPIENTLNGGVLQNMDLLARFSELSAVGEYTLCIEHRLITMAGADPSKVNRIFSHRQALDQCAEFLRRRYPLAELVPVNSTAAGVARIELPTDAAIAGVQNVKEGLEASSECISDEQNNFTHFLLVVNGAVPQNFRSEKVYFTLTCNHVPGALMHILEIIFRYNINMTKIESRPIKESPGEYRFFIEVEADYSAPQTKEVLSALERGSRSFRLIGCY